MQLGDLSGKSTIEIFLLFDNQDCTPFIPGYINESTSIQYKGIAVTASHTIRIGNFGSVKYFFKLRIVIRT